MHISLLHGDTSKHEIREVTKKTLLANGSWKAEQDQGFDGVQ